MSTTATKPPPPKPAKTADQLIREGYREWYGSYVPPLIDQKTKKPVRMKNGEVIPTPGWFVEAEITRGHMKVREYRGQLYHFKRFVSELFGDKSDSDGFFEWNPNAEKIVERAFGNRWLAIAGAASCVAGSTRLLDPRTGAQPTIKELCEANQRPWVMTLNGPVKADVPFVKGKTKMLEFHLSNGGVFKCTPEHRLLTSAGWVFAGSVEAGEELFGYSRDLEQSTLGNDPSVQMPDARHCSEKVPDSQSSCSACFHLCGEQLQSARDNARETLPSQVGAQGCTECAFSVQDDFLCESTRTHLCRSAALSTHSVSPPSSLLGSPSRSHCVGEIFSPPLLWSQQPGPSLQGNNLQRTFSARDQHFDHTQRMGIADAPREVFELPPALEHKSRCEGVSSSDQQQAGCSSASGKVSQSPRSSQYFSSISYEMNVQRTLVLSITKLPEEVFYDLNVPVEHHYFAEGAIHHNSGKTQVLAMYAVAMFLLWPTNTKVLVTSMTIASAEGKVWGHVEKYFLRASRMIGEAFMPGKLISSKHIIRRRTEDGKLSSTEGIELVPAEASEFKTSAKKLQGYKQASGRLIMCGDEWATLSPNLLATCKENLATNDGFQLLAAFNPESYFDPGGLISKPKAGWSSIDLDSEEWETEFENGWCVRFDGLKSPNVIAGREIWKGLMTTEALNNHRANFAGNESAVGFLKMVRGFWCATGSKESIFTEVEMENFRVQRKFTQWLSPPTKVAGHDPSFTHGGDRATLVIGETGMVHDPDSGIQKRVCQAVEVYVLDEEIDTSKDKNLQVVDKVAELLKKHGVLTEDLAVDISGAAAYGTLLAQKIGTGFLGVNFGGSPSDARVGGGSRKTGKEMYSNRASELWFGLKPLIRSGQIGGLDPDTISELCARTFTTKGEKTEIEPKEKMKQRTKKSPDRGDGWVLMVDVARKKHSLTALEKPPQKKVETQQATDIFGQFYNLEQLQKKRSGHRIDIPVLQEAGVASGGGWGE